MVTMSTFVSASISKNVYLVIVYMCAKFGAFIKKCTIFLFSHFTITLGCQVVLKHNFNWWTCAYYFKRNHKFKENYASANTLIIIGKLKSNKLLYTQLNVQYYQRRTAWKVTLPWKVRSFIGEVHAQTNN